MWLSASAAASGTFGSGSAALTSKAGEQLSFSKKLKILQRSFSEEGRSSEEQEQVAEALIEGRGDARFWQRVVHEDYALPPSEALEIKRAWVQWGKAGMKAVSAH